MKTIAENYAYDSGAGERAESGARIDPMLARIGDDLRHLYGDTMRSDPPGRLLELAEAIDARRAGQAGDE